MHTPDRLTDRLVNMVSYVPREFMQRGQHTSPAGVVGYLYRTSMLRTAFRALHDDSASPTSANDVFGYGIAWAVRMVFFL